MYIVQLYCVTIAVINYKYWGKEKNDCVMTIITANNRLQYYLYNIYYLPSDARADEALEVYNIVLHNSR